MGLFDGIKNILNVPAEDEYEEAIEEVEEPREAKRKIFAENKTESAKIIKGKEKVVPATPSQMQVVLVKAVRYDEVTAIADHIAENKTVVLNLEDSDRDNARRILDFLNGVVYNCRGDIKPVSSATFLVMPHGVDMSGEVLLDATLDTTVSYY
jgi:cell division inhibitor SepF